MQGVKASDGQDVKTSDMEIVEASASVIQEAGQPNVARSDRATGRRWPGLVSIVALVFSGISLYETVLKQATLSIYVGGVGHVTVHEHVLALDGLVVIVKPDNRVTALSLDQIARIFAGEITDWSQLGQQAAGQINLYIRNPDSGTRDTFDR